MIHKDGDRAGEGRMFGWLESVAWGGVRDRSALFLIKASVGLKYPFYCELKFLKSALHW